MSKRKPPRIVTGLYRFIHGIFDYYLDKGMTETGAKAKTYVDSYKVMQDLLAQEKHIPDHALVIAIEHSRASLQQRGNQIANTLKEERDEKRVEQLRQGLRDIKKAMEDVDIFIQNYRGETDGEEK